MHICLLADEKKEPKSFAKFTNIYLNSIICNQEWVHPSIAFPSVQEMELHPFEFGVYYTTEEMKGLEG